MLTSEEDEKSNLDLEVIPSEEEDLEIDVAPYDIRTLGADFSLELYSQKMESGEIIIPDFQRKYVWPIKKASRLIESFLLGLPVPQVFLYKESSNRDLLVVDGQQRLRTVQLFLRGTQLDGKTPFSLRGVKQKWEGKTFNGLEEVQKRDLKNYILRATIFEQIDPVDNQSVYEIFERLNTGGMALKEQEIRNCINRGTINEFLDELNKTESWRKLLGATEPDKRMKDIELIVRFLALIESWETYRKPMKDFISRYMERHVNITEADQETLTTLFKSVTDMIFEKAGVSAFRFSGGRINVAVLDSVMAAVALIGPTKIDDIKNQLETLKKDEAYGSYVSKSTTNDDSVKGRIKMSREIFSHQA